MNAADREIAGTPRDQRGDAPKQTAIRVSKLSKHYGDVKAVRGIDLDIGDGEIFGCSTCTVSRIALPEN